ncbi:MAG: DUF4912 domain-containing protein [Treponema sp.]|nr:DUF4912 domain-containing protein [Treponema sp.]
MKTSKKLSAAKILQVQPLAELNLAYLESLSTGELTELAAKNGLDIPPGLERAFIIEELFYLNKDIDDTERETEEADLHDSHHHEFKEFMTLPLQYHVSFIDVLIRDPLWAFVFWEIKASDRNIYENAADFKGYCLRVIPLKEDSLQPDEAASFMVTVDSGDTARYLGFPPEDGRCFKVELCMLNREDRAALAESRPFRLPRLIKLKPDEDIQAVYRNPLAQLSGVDRFSLVHSEDRLLRSRDSAPPVPASKG